MSEKLKPSPEKVYTKYKRAVDYYEKINNQNKSGRMIDDAKFLIRQAIKGDSRPGQVATAKAWIGQRNWHGEVYASDHLPELRAEAIAEMEAERKHKFDDGSVPPENKVFAENRSH